MAASVKAREQWNGKLNDLNPPHLMVWTEMRREVETMAHAEARGGRLAMKLMETSDANM